MANLPNNLGSISAYIIPSDDAHQSEYLAERDERRAFISGFDGSAGTAVVTEKEALLWTDGRYYQQAGKQLDSNWTLMKDGQPTTPGIDMWLANELQPGAKVGVDANLISTRAWNPLQTALKSAGCSLLPISPNLIDLVWENQPSAPNKPIVPLPVEFTGKSVAAKLEAVREEMREKRASLLVVSALDEIAWFLNLRGSDIDYNPVFLSYVLITLDDLFFFVDESKLSPNIYEHFRANDVQPKVHPYDEVHGMLKSLAKASSNRVWISLGSSYALTALIPEEKLMHAITPINLMKAVKNDVEASGMRACHVRDGVALCQYFAWLEKCIKDGVAVDEISGATRLEELRRLCDILL